MQKQIEAEAMKAIQTARHIIETHGELQSCVFFYSFNLKDGLRTSRMLLDMPESVMGRDIIALTLKMAAIEVNACASLFLSEAWFSSDPVYWNTRPAADPNRKEAVIALLETYEGIKTAQMEIRRFRGRSTFAIEPLKPIDKEASGRLLNLLPLKLGKQ